MSIYAISDIHGCERTFATMLDKIGFSKTDELYLLGDYIDRGPRSRQVLDRIMRLRDEGYTLRCLRGNHEQMMMDARHDIDISRAWMYNGGTAALDSFNAIDFSQIPQKYFDFLDALEHYYITDRFLFVHAGFNLSIEDPLDDKKSMLWMRKWEQQYDLSWLNGKIALNGHTPLSQGAIEARFDNLDMLPILDIDNGCAYAHEGYHQLCCVDLSNMKLYFQANVD